MDPSTPIERCTQADVDLAIHTSLDIIAQENTRLVSLRRRRNALGRACKLPNELLGEIFCYLVKATESFSEWPRPWLAVTHICYQWRVAAISYCSLWTDINLANSTDLSSVFAERAGNCPLDVRNVQKRHSGGFQAFAISFLLSHAYHIRSFERLSLSGKAHKLLGATLDHKTHFDLLETLEIRFARGLHEDTTTGFIEAGLPRLRNVSCLYAPQSFLVLLPHLSLTRLTISAPTTRRAAGSWIRFLQRCNMLEFLKLFDVFDAVEVLADLPTHEDSVLAHFPRLHSLDLHECGIGFALLQFFEHCCFPATTQVIMSCSQSFRPASIGRIMSSLAAVASGRAPNKLSMPFFQSLEIENEAVSLWTMEVPIVDKRVSRSNEKSPNPIWDLQVDMEWGVQPFLSAFSFSQPRQLSIDFTMPWVDVDMLLELRHYPSLRTLSITSRESVEAFIDAHNIVSSDSDQLLMPKLDQLILRNVAWKKHNDPDLRILEPLESCLGLRLEKMLASRKASGAPLTLLRHSGSLYLTAWDPMSLVERGVVNQVDSGEDGCEMDYYCGCDECEDYIREMSEDT